MRNMVNNRQGGHMPAEKEIKSPFSELHHNGLIVKDINKTKEV
jgi:hypothetical protein